MIVVKIELWPGGFENHPRKAEIGRMYIANDGARSVSDPGRGDYRVAVCRRGDSRIPREFTEDERSPKAARTGEVRDYPRLAYNVWRLVSRALRSAFPEER